MEGSIPPFILYIIRKMKFILGTIGAIDLLAAISTLLNTTLAGINEHKFGVAPLQRTRAASYFCIFYFEEIIKFNQLSN